ncbi:tyrosine-type recombinase/integrase [Enterobacter bugandensis]|nr:tyrosine-type recombinase/integrase [Enterobacter bugandensis]
MKKRKYLTQEEIKQLLEVSLQGKHGIRNHCIIHLLFRHGFRVSELCAMKISDIDMHGKTIHVSRLKNGFSTIHPIVKEEENALKKWLQKRKGLPLGDGWLFPSKDGCPLSRKTVYSIIRKMGSTARLALNIHPHMLRHSCGFALADQGNDTRLIQDYLGHRNIHHTVIYTASNSARFLKLWK